MQCKLKVQDYNDLYAYWQDTLAKVLLKEVHTHKEKYLLNLSSKEYEKAIRPYIPKEQWIDVIFQVEKRENVKLRQHRPRWQEDAWFTFWHSDK